VLNTTHGWLASLELPPPDSPSAEALIAALPEAESALVRTARPIRKLTFAAGRAVLRSALAAAGAIVAEDVPILADDRGAPLLPDPGFTASISHTDQVACALAERLDADRSFRIGLDVESIDAVPEGAEDLVVTAGERSRLAPPGTEARKLELALKIAIKEAFYKALDPFVRRTMNWTESEVWPRADGTVDARFYLAGGEGPFDADGTWTAEGRRVRAAMRVRSLRSR
jgi:4'-phosphopantetheinyl transferase EntD